MWYEHPEPCSWKIASVSSALVRSYPVRNEKIPKCQSCSLFKLWNGFIMFDDENVLFRPNKGNKQCCSLIMANKIYFWQEFYKWSPDMCNHHITISWTVLSEINLIHFVALKHTVIYQSVIVQKMCLVLFYFFAYKDKEH